jgi:hypothetical protein
MRLHRHVGQVVECAGVSGDDHSIRRHGRGRDDQVVRTAWSPLSTDGNQQACVCTSHLKVVVDYGNCF